MCLFVSNAKVSWNSFTKRNLRKLILTENFFCEIDKQNSVESLNVVGLEAVSNLNTTMDKLNQDILMNLI